MMILALAAGFTILGLSYASPDPIYRFMAAGVFIAGMGVTMSYGFLLIPYRGNMSTGGKMIVIGEGEVDIHYTSSNAAEESLPFVDESGNVEPGRYSRTLPLDDPANFSAFPDSPDAPFVDILHYGRWNDRVGRVGDTMMKDRIAYWNRDTETLIVKPLKTPQHQIVGKDGKHRWIPSFELIMTVHGDAAESIEPFLLAQQIKFYVKERMMKFVGMTEEEAYADIVKEIGTMLQKKFAVAVEAHV